MFIKQNINKIFLGFIIPLTATLFVACSSTSLVKPSCVYPDAPKSSAPEWICNPSKVTGALIAVGSSKSSNAFLREQKCLGAARLSMAQTLEVSVKGMFQEYAESTGSGDAETLDQMSKAVTEQLTQATLHGTSPKRYATSPKGSYYCLVAMEVGKYEAIAAAAKKALKTSMGNQRALWQKFQAEKSIEEMTKKLEKQEKKEKGN
ncbi:MAG: hypothetical protein DRR16_21520 [Candidatus Parabeggiatoa sp. nov. 3]|nr:MAG: hypothetical protein DRR00_25720 [Gammaproteobacteria bacterium]RKZ60379.1 MAG: hypothetical protein DRQ99_22145 [Gammaproteobacteria bacterium]RKZ81709.1 MAG: hypothetical protein DRR16_21520 [Gammaproteobacteria bacterium]HEW97928.1 hypothetical protein [Beggiatoa sp.]